MEKVGIIGTGWIAEVHVKMLKKLGISVHAVVASTMQKAAAFAEQWGIPRYGTELELLFDSEICAVHICTPPQLHFEQICLLLSKGKHIFCEKPLSLSPEEARELAKMAQASDRVCCVGFNTRSYALCRKARNMVQKGILGRLLLIHGSYLQEFGANPAVWSWRYESKLHAVTEIGSHWLDLAQYISGEKIVAVSAVFDRFHPRRYRKDGLVYAQVIEGAQSVAVPSEDVALIHFRTANGAIGSVVLSELSHGHENQLRIELTGEDASIAWNSDNPTELSLSHKGQTVLYSHEDSFENTFVAEFEAFYRAIRTGTFEGPDFYEAYRNTLLCEAIAQSAENHSAWMEVAL